MKKIEKFKTRDFLLYFLAFSITTLIDLVLHTQITLILFGAIFVISISKILYLLIRNKIISSLIQPYRWLVFVIIASLMVPVIINESYKYGKGYLTVWSGGELLNFYGSYLAFIGTFSLGYMVFKNDKRRSVELAKINGKTLCSIITSVEHQRDAIISGISNLRNIEYDKDWRQYFFQFFGADANYHRSFLHNLDDFFLYIDNLNSVLNGDNYEESIKIVNLRNINFINRQNRSLEPYNFYETQSILHDLAYSTNVVKVEIPWTEDEETNKTISQMTSELFPAIENWIFNYLLKTNQRSVDRADVDEKLLHFLLLNAEVKDVDQSRFGRRIIHKIVLNTSLRLNEEINSRVNLYWGYYSLK